MRIEERPLIRDEHRYVAHPHMAQLASGVWLLVANCAPRRIVTMHPPQDPEYFNILIRSDDEGRSWSPPEVVPAYGHTGTECAGLTPLADGGLLLNQWRFRWYPYTGAPTVDEEPLIQWPEALKRTLLESSELEAKSIASVPPERLMPWARGGGETVVHRSDDGGHTWTHAARIATDPYSGGYGMRGAIVQANGDILLPLSDVPNYARIFLVRSNNGGRTWGAPEPVAAVAGLAFEEPAPLILGDGTILMLLRENVSHTLYGVRSDDGGRSWSTPTPTGIDCYPAHLVDLRDGRIAAVAGRRQPPYRVALFMSMNHGRTWAVERPIEVRAGLPNEDLGYPTATLRSDGTLFVAYYYRDMSGVTGVHATTVAI